MKVCSNCQRTQDLESFTADRRAVDGKQSQCKSCHALSVRLWREQNTELVGTRAVSYRRRHRHRHQKEIAESHRRYASLYPERLRANAAVRRAIGRGILIRPMRCSKCRRSGKIEASHGDYGKPLQIEWLCRRCHIAKDEHPWFTRAISPSQRSPEAEAPRSP